MAFDINEFVSDIHQRGVAKSSTFDVIVTGPLTDSYSMRTLALRADSIAYPGRNLQTHEHRYTGPPIKIANGFVPSDLQISFILSNDLQEKRYFDEWHDLIIGPSRVNGGVIINRPFDVAYYNDYAKPFSVTIRQYSEVGTSPKTGDGEPIVLNEAVFLETYPQYVGEIDHTWRDASIPRFVVKFNYRYFHTTKPTFPTTIPKSKVLVSLPFDIR